MDGYGVISAWMHFDAFCGYVWIDSRWFLGVLRLGSTVSVKNKIWVCLKIRPHRLGGEGVLIGGAHSNTKCSMTFVNIAVAISALAGGGGQKRFRTETGGQRVNWLPCNLQWILLLVFKNIVFYRVSGPSAAQNCTLAMLKNVGFSTVFAWRVGKNRKKLSLKMFST